MIRLHLEDNTPRLFNPDLIQEVGVGQRIKLGADFEPERNSVGEMIYEPYNFLLMSGGHDPIRIQEDPETVACLKAVWDQRYNLRTETLAAVYVNDQGDASFVAAGA